MTPHLILIRHSISRQQPDVDSHEWELTEEGRVRCHTLAERLRVYQPTVIATSAEPKAVQTGAVLAETYGLEPEIITDLGEQRRATAPWLGSESAFREKIRLLLRQPDDLIYGEETGTAAADRMQAALDSLVARYAGQTLAAVSHGTIMALFLARVTELDPVAFWEQIDMPAYVVLRRPDYALIEAVYSLT
jgi:broad specificity phosphatase PhoE